MGVEGKFRLYFRHLLRKSGVWTAAVEHRSGGSTGVGDLLVQCGDALLPVELKVGEWRQATRRLHSSRIRPGQIRFLNEAFEAGIRARLVIGGYDNDGGWTAWLVRDVSATRLSAWKKGFCHDELVTLMRRDELLIPVERW